MNTVTTGNDFEGIRDGNNRIDIPEGDNEQVLGMAFMQNAGQAIGEDDLYPPGEYVLHTFPGLFEVKVIKHNKIDYTFVTNVYDHVIQEYRKSLQLKKDQFAASDGKEGSMVYDVPIWVIFEMAMNLGVHPSFDEKTFEQALWDYFPDLWIDESKAPKRIIS